MSSKHSYSKLIAQYPVFEFRNYDYKFAATALEISFDFAIPNLAQFRPTWSIPLGKQFGGSKFQKNPTIERLVFALGMTELISYWKLTCSPQINVLCGQLQSDQANWWGKLYRNGLGEFFYVNGINAEEVCLNIAGQLGSDPAGNSTAELGSDPTGNFTAESAELGSDPILVPIGGGKDSAVSLELLKPHYSVVPFAINPRQAASDTIKAAELPESSALIAHRTLDPTLLDLNAQGYLNGHTPFSAIVAFSSVLTAYLNGIAKVALSNESSANEATIAGSMVNHQYSKSFEFESDFRSYNTNYIHSGVDYFSLLRPFNELQIAQMFSNYPQFFSVFRSCNVGEQTNSWCGQCAKCLFVYVILSPFVDEAELIKIFGRNLLKDKSLKPLLNELSGALPNKPFECVGTRAEVQAVLAQDQTEIEHLLRNTSSEHNIPAIVVKLLWGQTPNTANF